MFRSSTIIRELAQNLAKGIFMLQHSVNYVVIYYAVVWQHVMKWRVCFMSNSTQHTTHKPFHYMLPYKRIINNDVIHRML